MNQIFPFPSPLSSKDQSSNSNLVLKPHYIECVPSDSSIMSHFLPLNIFISNSWSSCLAKNNEHKQSGHSHSSKRGAWGLWMNPEVAGVSLWIQVSELTIKTASGGRESPTKPSSTNSGPEPSTKSLWRQQYHWVLMMASLWPFSRFSNHSYGIS